MCVSTIHVLTHPFLQSPLFSAAAKAHETNLAYQAAENNFENFNCVSASLVSCH